MSYTNGLAYALAKPLEGEYADPPLSTNERAAGVVDAFKAGPGARAAFTDALDAITKSLEHPHGYPAPHDARLQSDGALQELASSSPTSRWTNI